MVAATHATGDAKFSATLWRCCCFLTLSAHSITDCEAARTCHNLPKPATACHDLPPSAMICHGLSISGGFASWFTAGSSGDRTRRFRVNVSAWRRVRVRQFVEHGFRHPAEFDERAGVQRSWPLSPSAITQECRALSGTPQSFRRRRGTMTTPRVGMPGVAWNTGVAWNKRLYPRMSSCHRPGAATSSRGAGVGMPGDTKLARKKVKRWRGDERSFRTGGCVALLAGGGGWGRVNRHFQERHMLLEFAHDHQRSTRCDGHGSCTGRGVSCPGEQPAAANPTGCRFYPWDFGGHRRHRDDRLAGAGDDRHSVRAGDSGDRVCLGAAVAPLSEAARSTNRGLDGQGCFAGDRFTPGPATI